MGMQNRSIDWNGFVKTGELQLQQSVAPTLAPSIGMNSLVKQETSKFVQNVSSALLGINYAVDPLLDVRQAQRAQMQTQMKGFSQYLQANGYPAEQANDTACAMMRQVQGEAQKLAENQVKAENGAEPQNQHRARPGFGQVSQAQKTEELYEQYLNNLRYGSGNQPGPAPAA